LLDLMGQAVRVVVKVASLGRCITRLGGYGIYN